MTEVDKIYWKHEYQRRQQYQCDYYYDNRDDLLKKRKKKYYAKKTCRFCGKSFEKKVVINYKNKYFCDRQCLGGWLISRIEDDLKTIRIDTSYLDNPEVVIDGEQKNEK